MVGEDLCRGWNMWSLWLTARSLGFIPVVAGRRARIRYPCYNLESHTKF